MLLLIRSFVTCYVSGARPGSLQAAPRLSSLAKGKRGASITCTKRSSKIFIRAVEAPALLQADKFSPDRTPPLLRQAPQNCMCCCHARYLLMRPFFFFPFKLLR